MLFICSQLCKSKKGSNRFVRGFPTVSLLGLQPCTAASADHLASHPEVVDSNELSGLLPVSESYSLLFILVYLAVRISRQKRTPSLELRYGTAMTALCPPPLVLSADEAGFRKWWFINKAPNLNISNLLSILKPSPVPEEINPRTVAGHCRRRDTRSTVLPPPQAVKSSSLQKQPREAATHDRKSSCGDDGNNGHGGGGRLNKGHCPRPQGEMNRYWIPNFDIDKRVITQEIQYYLGPGSAVRPYTREVSTYGDLGNTP